MKKEFPNPGGKMYGIRTFVTIVSLVVFSCFILFNMLACSESDLINSKEADSISKNSLLDDIDYFVSKIEEAHADPYRLISREEFKKAVFRLKDYVRTMKQDGLSLWKCYYILEELAATIQDEHTMIIPPIQLISETELFFPFKIKVMGEKIFIAENLGNTKVPEFSELMTINSVNARSIWKKCLKYLNPPLPHAKVNIFEKIINLYLTTFFNIHSPWKIKYRSETGVNKATVKGIRAQILFTRLFGPFPYSEKQLTIKGKEIPVLDIPGFEYGSFEDYQQFIDSFFERYKDKETLIIDLRQNPGGNGSWGYYLLDYITKSPYKITDKFIFKVSEVFKNSSYRYKAGEGLVGAKNGTYIPNSMSKIRNPQVKRNKFLGKVFLLVSNSTNSAGVVTAAIFKYNKMGTIIGQETTGRTLFNSDPVRVMLPKSKLWAQIPVAIYALPGHTPDQGVIPDIIIKYSVEEMKKGLDKEMDKVKELLHISQ